MRKNTKIISDICKKNVVESNFQGTYTYTKKLVPCEAFNVFEELRAKRRGEVRASGN